MLETSSTTSIITKFMNDLDKLQVLYLSAYFFCQSWESPKLPVYRDDGEERWDSSYQKQWCGGSYLKKEIFQYRILWWDLASKLKLNQCRKNFAGHMSWQNHKLVLIRCRYKSINYMPLTVSNILRPPVVGSSMNQVSCNDRN